MGLSTREHREETRWELEILNKCKLDMRYEMCDGKGKGCDAHITHPTSTTRIEVVTICSRSG